MAWTKKYEWKYWKKTGLKKGAGIYNNYYKAFNLDKYDFTGYTVADIGYGPFRGILPLLNASTTYAVDVMADKYREATSKEFESGDLNGSLPFGEYNLGAVFCFNAIDHIKDPLHGMQELYRVLEKDGRLFLHVHLRTKAMLNKGHVHVVTMKDVATWARKAGFKTEDLWADTDWVNDEPQRDAAYGVFKR